jgi:predicted ATPase
VTSERLLTIVGPAGIGKTSVAVAAAERLIGAYDDGIWRIDLASITDPRLVPTALASALRIASRSDDPLPGLIAAVKDMQMLFVLDNCEHLIEPAAAVAIAILRGSRSIQILATSREPLDVEGERVHRLSALESPPESIGLNAVEALRFPAVQLFVERATATMNEFELSDNDAPGAAGICRKLDGVPLAIEFAAARVDTFGVRGLAARLDDQMPLLGGGPRLAPPRHRTISAALDWSYQLLSQEEQTVFRRLAILVGDFTLETAIAVAAGSDRMSLDIAFIVESLVMKSLVTANVDDGQVRFRLFETTRAYALTKLAESGESDVPGPNGRQSFPCNERRPSGTSPRRMFLPQPTAN